jgi:phage terminase large subunit-like protein
VDSTISYSQVYASRGKYTRAEPISALYEQGRVHHVGAFPKLEDQCCQWEPLIGLKSPDRLDALVWALTKLMLGTHTGGMALAADPDENYEDEENEEDLSLWR